MDTSEDGGKKLGSKDERIKKDERMRGMQKKE